MNISYLYANAQSLLEVFFKWWTSPTSLTIQWVDNDGIITDYVLTSLPMMMGIMMRTNAIHGLGSNDRGAWVENIVYITGDKVICNEICWVKTENNTNLGQPSEANGWTACMTTTPCVNFTGGCK